MYLSFFSALAGAEIKSSFSLFFIFAVLVCRDASVRAVESTGDRLN